MLSADNRSLYTAALTPPPGYSFGEALATTYSLDPTTLLTVPLHLALLGSGQQEVLLRDQVALLEALRRLRDRITIYAQRGRMQAPGARHALYGLIEPMVVEVHPPRSGVFHPKLWILKFNAQDVGEPGLLRVLVLSRNLTADQSWDLSLQLEGSVTEREHKGNEALAELIRTLPSLAHDGTSAERCTQAERLSEAVSRTKWEMPDGFERIRFHVLGFNGKRWLPPRSEALAVISPFVEPGALEALRNTTEKPLALIARPNELDALTEDERSAFGHCLILDEAAESEDGEETLERDTLGLHAKAFFLHRNENLHLFVGSANATSAALLAGINVEVVAELIGPKTKRQRIEALLGEDGLADILVPYTAPDKLPDKDSEAESAEKALEDLRRSLSAAKLLVRCAREESDWALSLRIEKPIVAEGVANIRAWPVTITPEQAVDAGMLLRGQEILLGRLATASVTGLIAFEVTAKAKPISVRFVLNIPVDGLPAERDAAILRTAVRNQDGFLRYLLLLLGELGMQKVSLPPGNGGGGGWAGFTGSAAIPLLEELTRTYSRDPERLREVGQVVARLQEGNDGEQIVPPEFLELWRVFADALEAEK
jgi:hypothetical protein